MKAAIYHTFGGPVIIQTVPDPRPDPHGAVIRVMATGICRSDWHGWQGHDPDIKLPHVPGHELAGVIEAIGKRVNRWQPGDRVTVPFVCGCGRCEQCATGHHQVCPNQTQPGFTHWGSFAEFVAIHNADVNLVRLPDRLDFATAASLGCRFITAFRAVIDQGRVSGGEWVAVHGCGGLGLSAVMVANAVGAQVVAIDINPTALDLARSLGATVTINAHEHENIPAAVQLATRGGAHVSLDALGSIETCRNSILSLRKRGRHVQVGLLLENHSQPPLPMDRVIAHELEIVGSHGMPAHRYADMFELIRTGKLQPERLVQRTVSLEEADQVLTDMEGFNTIGVVVIDHF